MKQCIFSLFSLNFYFKEHHYCYCKEKIAIEGADCKNFEKPIEKHKYRPQGSKIPKKKSRGPGKKTQYIYIYKTKKIKKKQKNKKKKTKKKKQKKTIFYNSCSRPPPDPRPLDNCFFLFFFLIFFGFFP